MRVAITVNSSWNIYNFRSGLVKALLSQGVEVLAIAPKDSYSDLLIEMGCSYFPIKIENKGSNPIKDFLLIFQLYKIYKKYRPDIILHFTIKPNIYGAIAAGMLRIPVVNNVSGLGTVFLHKNLTSYIAKWLYKFSFRIPKKVFFQNPDDLNLFISQHLVSETITGLLPGSGVDTKKFAPRVTLTKNKVFTYLLVARMLYDKGIIEYVEAIKLLKNKGLKARFQILGALEEVAKLGIDSAKIKEWEAKGLLEYYPFTNNLADYYHQADCVVLPSYREGTPRSLLEAGACGIPMIATNVPGCKEAVVDTKNGFLCNVKDSKDLALTMEKLFYLSERDRLEMGKYARIYILANFDENIVINTYLTTLNCILSGKGTLLKMKTKI